MLNVHRSRSSSAVLEKMFSTALASYIASSLAMAIGPLVDGVIVGSYYSVDSVAAIGLTSFLLVGYRTLTASILSKGSHVIASERIGEGDKEGANRVFSVTLLLTIAFSVVLSLLSIVFSEQIAVFTGARSALADLMIPASDYLKGYCVGLPFFAMLFVLTPFLQMDGDYNLVTLSSVVMTIVDIAADLFVVNVTKGWLFQIGLATSVGHLAAFLVVASHFVFKKTHFHFSWKEIRLSEFRDILITGMPVGVVKLSNTFCGILINQMLAVSFTSGVVAALGVGNQLFKLCFFLWLGPAYTLMSFASLFFGEEDRKALRDIQEISIRKGLLLTCCAAAAVFAFAVPLAYVFIRNGDDQIRKMTADAIRFIALSMPLNVFIYGFQQYLIGAGRKLFANIFSFILDFGIPVPLTMLFLAVLGYRGAWISKPVINAAVILAAVIYILHQKGTDFREKALLLNDNFDTAPGHELYIEADSMFDIMGISRVSIAFIMENGFNKQDANKVSLAIEELAGNIVQHGFMDGRHHHVYIRILVKGDEMILRLRDDCRPFDPVEKYRIELMLDNDPENGIAIKMMMRMCKEIKYNRIYCMNNLIIHV